MSRPKLPKSAQRQAISITLPGKVIRLARELGEGNVSRGIELLVAMAQGEIAKRPPKDPSEAPPKEPPSIHDLDIKEEIFK